MIKRNKFKLISVYAIFSMSYNLNSNFSEDYLFVFFISLLSALVFGLIIGGYLDYKSNKRREIRELNKNIQELKKTNFTASTNDDIISKLERLNNLKNNNSITEEEYINLKNQLLNIK